MIHTFRNCCEIGPPGADEGDESGCGDGTEGALLGLLGAQIQMTAVEGPSAACGCRKLGQIRRPADTRARVPESVPSQRLRCNARAWGSEACGRLLSE